ncbi:hypothetical protein B0H10DRAFT_2234486 [Mycena sp. CBHHK59/15]|nr:hypothetical protein B0H10DRAFT_2234486 [Mycena sp. CBHHK59/15]
MGFNNADDTEDEDGVPRLSRGSLEPARLILLTDLNKLVIAAWYAALKQLCDTHGYHGVTLPTEDELSLVKAWHDQVKGNIKEIAHAVICGTKGYKFATENETKSINDNGELVKNLLTNDSFLYCVPTNRSLLGSLFQHAAIQELLNKVFYKDEGKSEAVLCPTYFKAGCPLPGISIFVTAIKCTIMEWETGTLVKCHFVVKTFQPDYKRHMRTLMDWRVFTTNSGSELMKNLQLCLIQNAHQYNPSGDLPAGLSTANFAANEV